MSHWCRICVVGAWTLAALALPAWASATQEPSWSQYREPLLGHYAHMIDLPFGSFGPISAEAKQALTLAKRGDDLGAVRVAQARIEKDRNDIEAALVLGWSAKQLGTIKKVRDAMAGRYVRGDASMGPAILMVCTFHELPGWFEPADGNVCGVQAHPFLLSTPSFTLSYLALFEPSADKDLFKRFVGRATGRYPKSYGLRLYELMVARRFGIATRGGEAPPSRAVVLAKSRENDRRAALLAAAMVRDFPNRPEAWFMAGLAVGGTPEMRSLRRRYYERYLQFPDANPHRVKKVREDLAKMPRG
ncbi:MAG: hypothetical protein MH204_02685 [Fimbriimonadaceae bacterium]|nr:hypothetical protein [Fimbriimonadaceae bacterium]